MDHAGDECWLQERNLSDRREQEAIANLALVYVVDVNRRRSLHFHQTCAGLTGAASADTNAASVADWVSGENANIDESDTSAK